MVKKSQKTDAIRYDRLTSISNLPAGTWRIVYALGCLVSLLANAIPAFADTPNLDGGFIQFFSGDMPKNWGQKKFIDYQAYTNDLRTKLKLKTIVVQNSSYSSDGKEALLDTTGADCSYVGSDSQAGDPIDDILVAAKNASPAMQVILGLEYNKPFMASIGDSNTEANFGIQQAHDENLVDKLVKRYSNDKKRQIDGWYIVTEIGNNDWSGHSEFVKAFHNYIDNVALHCKGKIAAPVFISAYLDPRSNNLMGADAAKQLAAIVKDTAVDGIFLQDGAGAFSNTDTNIIAFFTNLQSVFKDLKNKNSNCKVPTIAADIELFDGTHVSTIDHVQERLQRQGSLGITSIIGYDVFNFMNPTYQGDDTDVFGQPLVTSHPFAARKALCNDYAKKILKSSTPIFCP